MERKKASDFPQELLSLLDEYVHGAISRRAFLDGAQKFAVGGVTAAALVEMLRPNYAWAIQVQPNDSRIKAETATVPSPQGNGTIKGYLVRPAAPGKLPVVLVIHENRGLNPYIEDVAQRTHNLARGRANLVASSRLAQMLGLYFEKAGFNCGGAAQSPQQAGQPQHQFSLHSGFSTVVGNDGSLEGSVIFGIF